MKPLTVNLCKIFYNWNIGKIFYICYTVYVLTLNTLPFCYLKLSQFSPQPSPLLAHLSHPSPAPSSSAPANTGSPFTGAAHHHWLHVIDATFSSQVRVLIFLTVFRCSPSLFLLLFFFSPPLSILFSWVSGDWVMVELAFSGTKVDLVIEIG